MCRADLGAERRGPVLESEDGTTDRYVAASAGGGVMQYAIGCESEIWCWTLFLPSVSQTTKPRSSSPRFGGMPRFFSVSSTLSYQTPIFMILRASSAVAILRPNRSLSSTAALIWSIDVMR